MNRSARLFLLAGLLGVAGCEDRLLQEHRSALQPDYPPAAYQQALAYAAGRQAGFQPSFIIVHVAQGYYTGTISWFKDPQSGVSSHYVVSKNGDVTQMVEEKDTAYHIGSALSLTSIGIEHEGFVADPAKWFTDAMYSGSAKLVQNITERWGIPRDRCHVLGHDEVPDPKNPCTFGGSEHHTDPGSGWDWSKYMGFIGGSSTACKWDCTATKGSLVGFVRSGALLPGAPPVVGAKVTIGASTIVTDATGFYRFDGLSMGSYFKITVSAAGFQTATQNQAVVIPLDNYSNFALKKSTTVDSGPGLESGIGLEPTAPRVDGGPPARDAAGPAAAEAAAAAAQSTEEEEPSPEPSGGSSGCSTASRRDPATAALLLLVPLLLLAVRGRRRPQA